MNLPQDPLQSLIDNRLALGTQKQVNPFIPTAKYETTGSSSPFFIDEAKRSEEFELLQQIRRGQAGVAFTGNQDEYEWYQDRPSDPNALGNLGAEYRQKYDIRSSKGLGEQNTYARDAWLRWMKGESSTYFWNPQNLEDPSNVHNQSSYMDALGEGIGKWFSSYEADAEFQDMKSKIDTVDPTFTEAIKIDQTTKFLSENVGVERVLRAGGVELYEYTKNANNPLAFRFNIHNAVMDSLQNIRLKKWNENNQMFGSQTFDTVAYGIQDPLLVRDLVATTALTLGLGTVEVGASRLASALGQASINGSRAMSIARGASNALQLTSPFTGLAEGLGYKAIQSAFSNVGKQGFQTFAARTMAIGGEAGLASGLANYADQKNAYDWRQLVFQNEENKFKPDWMQVGSSTAAGFAAGSAMLGLMRFGIGGLGDIRFVVNGDMRGFGKSVVSSLDTWARTKDGLTVFGDKLSGGRGMLFGDFVDKYMSSSVDKRDFASILVNGSRLFSTAGFSPTVAAKSNFDESAAIKVATQFEQATGLPGEIVQTLPATHPVRIMFDNLVDPEYLKRTGMSYGEAETIIKKFNERRSGLIGPIEPGVQTAVARTMDEYKATNSIQALAEIFEVDRISRILQREGVNFEAVNKMHFEATGKNLDFGIQNHRENFRTVANYAVNGKRLADKNLDILRWAKPGALFDLSLPDGTTIKGDVVSETLRKTLDLDNRTSRLFITDSEDGSSPSFVISVEPDGTITRHATRLIKDSQDRIIVDSEITKSADYKPENIKTAEDMQVAMAEIKKAVDLAHEAVKKEEAEAKAARLEKLKKTSKAVEEATKEIGKSPTRKILKKHFNLNSEEAVMAEIVMETLGMDIEGTIIKIAEARGKSLERLEKVKAKASISWSSIESGIKALIRTTKHSDFGSLVHEMGHYNRMLLIGSTEEHKANRHKIGITDDMWNKFVDWVGYKGDWESDVSKMSKEQIKAEEKFANAWAYYIRNIMVGDGKTNATGLHRLFSAMGDHLGDLGKKMESQRELEVDLKFTDEAKQVFDKLFLRSEPKLTKFWQLAEKGIFKSLDPEQRAKLGEIVLGTELWNSYKGSIEKSITKTREKTEGIATPRPKKIKINEHVDSIRAKISGEAFSPTKKAIKEALNAKQTEDAILSRIDVLRKGLENPDTLPSSALRSLNGDAYFASHVKGLSDDQLKALEEGKTLPPISGIVMWVFKDGQIDVSFPVVKVTKELVEKELRRRDASRAALKRLSEATKTKEKVAEERAKVEKPAADIVTVDKTAEKPAEAAVSSFVEETLSEIKSDIPTREELVDEVAAKLEGKESLSDALGVEETPDLREKLVEKVEEVAKKLDDLSDSRTKLEELKVQEEDAVLQIADSIAEIERTKIEEPEVVDTVEPMAALEEIKAASDEKFVDNADNPVPDLSESEKIYAESTQEVVNDVVEVQEQVIAAVVNLADPTVPVTTRPPRRTRKTKKVNTEVSVAAAVTDSVAVISETVDAMRTRADAVGELLPTNLREQADVVVNIGTAVPESIGKILNDVLASDALDPVLSARFMDILNEYIDLKVRYSLADNLLVRLGFVSRESLSAYNALDQNIRNALDKSTDIDQLVRIKTDPMVRNYKLPENPTESDKLFFAEVVSYRELEKTLVDRISSSLEIDVDAINKYVDYKVQVVLGSIELANKNDLEVIAKYEPDVEKLSKALKALEESPDNAEAKKLVAELKKTVGYYEAALERVTNRSLVGTSIVSSTKKEKTLIQTVKDIMEEGQKFSAPKSVADTLMSNADAMAASSGLKAGEPRNVEAANIADIFSLGTPEKPTKNLPFLRDPKTFREAPISGKTFGLNTAKLKALVLTNEFIKNGGINFAKSVETSPVAFVDSAFDSPNKLYKAAIEDGFAFANDNPFVYNSMLALVLDGQHAITNMYKQDFKNLLVEGANYEVQYVESVLRINNGAKTEAIPAGAATPEKLTERRLAYLLLSDKNFTSRLDKVTQRSNVSFQDVVAIVYRRRNGLSSWLKDKLELNPEATLDEVLDAAKLWGTEGGSKTKLHSSANLIATRLQIDLESSGDKTISGDVSFGEEKTVFSTIGEDLRPEMRKQELAAYSFADKIQSLFYQFIKTKKIAEDTFDLGSVYVARIQATSQKGNEIQTTIDLIKELTGVELSVRQIEHREKVISKELNNFFDMLDESVLIDDRIKNAISIFKQERLGIGEKTKKPKGELTQGKDTTEVLTALQLREMIYKKEVKNAEEVLNFISSSNSEFKHVAKQLLVNDQRLKRIKVFPSIRNIELSNASYYSGLGYVVANEGYRNVPYAYEAETMIHEIVHALTTDNILTMGYNVGSKTYGVEELDNLSGIKYYNTVVKMIQQKPEKYDPVYELLSAYVETINYLGADKKLIAGSASSKFSVAASSKYPADFYGLTNVIEFVAEAMSSKDFAKKLSEIPTTTQADLSVFNRLYKAILHLLGVNPKEVNVLLKTAFAIDAIKKDTNDYSSISFFRQLGVKSIAPELYKAIKDAFKDYRQTKAFMRQEALKAEKDLLSAKGRLDNGLSDSELYQSLLDTATSSDNFKKFFEGSKVVESTSVNGGSSTRPLLMYHGTGSAGFSEFKYDFSKSYDYLLWGNGVYLTENPKVASSYAKPKALKGYTIDFDGAQYAAPDDKNLSLDYFELKNIIGKDEHSVDILDNYSETQINTYDLKYFVKYLEDEGADSDTVTKILDRYGYKKVEATEGVYPLYASIAKPIDADNDVFNGQYLINLVNRLDDEDKLRLVDVLTGLFTVSRREAFEDIPEIANILKSIPYSTFFITTVKEKSYILSAAYDKRKAIIYSKKISDGTYRSLDLADDSVYFPVAMQDKNSLAVLPKYHVMVISEQDLLKYGIPLETKLPKNQELKTISTPETTNRKFDEFFNSVKDQNLEHLLIQALMLDGYDGITHIGGGRAGGGKTMHRVWISWKPGQVKSAFNLGNWDSRLNNMLMQGRIDTDSLIDAVDLRRRKLAELGFKEELTGDDISKIQRVLNGLSPVDIYDNLVFDNIKSEFKLSPAITPKKDYIGKDYRELSTDDRKDFIMNTLVPKIRQAMGDRNSSAGLYSVASDSRFGKKVNALIGGAAKYGDTADSNSIFLQFVSKIFDPMMDMRDGELKNKWNMPSVDKLNAEVNNILLRSNLIQTQNKILSRVKEPAELQRIMDTAWLYLTRPEAVPDGSNKDLILDLINARNKFNEITVELLSNYGSLSKKTDPRQYGTSHVASNYAKQNQKKFVDALTAHAVRKTIKSNQISVITAEALGWVEIKRDNVTDEIVSIIIKGDSPIAKIADEKMIDKKMKWAKDTRKLFEDVTKLDKEARNVHSKALVSNEGYSDVWRQAYGDKGTDFTAIRQSMDIAKNRYLGISFTDSKSANPRRMAIGEGRNYTEERIISHEEITSDPQMAKFFSSDILDLSHSELRGSVTDAVMTKYLTDFFGTRMSMSDLLQILASSAEEFEGRANLSASEVASRQRGYERLRNSWNHSIGNWMSAYDSMDENYKAVLEGSRSLVVLASGLRASLMSVPETARALLTSNKNKSMLMQFLPNLVKLVRLVGPGGKERRLARAQMISASHWLRGLATEHMLHRNGIHPENPFQGVVFGQNAGGMVGNFVNAWRSASESNKTETNYIRKLMNRSGAFAAAAEAPLAFVNDVTTTLHIWNAQENLTTNLDAFRKMAEILNKNPAASYSEFAQFAKKCGLAPKEALDLNSAGLLNLKHINIIAKAATMDSLKTDGIMDVRKMYVWAGEDSEKIDAINTMGGYINMTARHTNVEPTLLDIRVDQSIYGKALAQYMQFLLSVGVQGIGRRRRTMTSGYSQHLAGLVLMEITAYGISRALSDPSNEEQGGYDEFVENPMDYLVRTATSLPLLGSYAYLGNVTRHAIMGTSEFFGGPGSEQEFRLPDLISGPASTSPRRLLGAPDTIKSWYNEGHSILTELMAD